VVAAFLMAQWLLLTDSGSFTGLLGFIGVIIVPLLGGIFPVLLLYASRRKGERVPTAVYRFLGNPVLLTAIYVVFLLSILLHGLVIWTDPLQRILAVATSVMVVAMTITMRKTFERRTIVELREEDEQAFFSVTEAGHPAVAEVRLEYLGEERRYETASGEIPAFSSLRRATFQTERGAGVLKVWAHRITPEGNSEGLAGLLRVRLGNETRQFDLKLSGGQVVLPTGACQVEITFAEAGTFES
jgi:hypothetical protein